jgi:hypothetical protein
MPRRTRSSNALSWLSLAAVLPVLGTLLAVGLSPNPSADGVGSARRALRKAQRDAGLLAPDAVARATLAAQAMEVEWARARASWWPARHGDEVTARARDAEALALRASWLARTRASRTAADVSREVALQHDRLAGLLPHLAEFPGDRELRGALRRAELALGAVAKDLETGAPGRAFASLEQASASLERAEARLERRTERLGDPAWLRRWQVWADATVAATSAGSSAVVVEKAGGVCHLVSRGAVAESFRCEIGRAGLSLKHHAGDAATPEGRYRVAERRDLGDTRYHRALLLDYPNAEDRARFVEERRQRLFAAGRSIGGLIEIHGRGGKGSNWTDGCVALADEDMDRLFAAVAPGTPVTIVGRARVPGEVEGGPERE